MSDTAEDVIRRDVGKLLRVDYRGQIMCASCLLKLTVERFGTALYTTDRIERALETVFRSPGALRRVHAFVCDQCGQTIHCLTAPPGRGPSA